MGNARIRTLVEYADNSDYYKALTEQYERTESPTYRLAASLSAATTGTTLELGPYTSTGTIILANTDTSNSVYATFYQQLGTYAAGDLTFDDPASGNDTILDNNGGNLTTTPEFASVGDWVRVASATVAGNDGLYLITNISDSGATNDLITINNSDTLTDSVNDLTATLSFESKTRLVIPASGHVVLSTAVVASDIVLTARTAACVVEVYGMAS
jgi:hypothetical protein